MAAPVGERIGSEDETMTGAAMAVLQHRLAGSSHGDALTRVAASHALSPGDVDRSWLHKKRDALTVLTIGRVVDACPWTEAEVEQLVLIYAGEPWFAPSGSGSETSPA